MVPIDYWFKNVLATKLKKLLKNRKHNLYDAEYVYELIDQIKKLSKNKDPNNLITKITNPTAYISKKLWSILIFEMWYEEFIA